MYEAEVNFAREPISALPAEIRLKFQEYRSSVTARTVLPWGEHCTECVWPSCYSTCAFYERRSDGACRQFIGSAVRLDNRLGLNPYVLKIRFKRWAKFWTVGNLDLKSLPLADREERKNIAAGAVARNLPLPASFKARALGKLNYVRRTAAEAAPRGPKSPDAFLFECYNPGHDPVSFTFTVRAKDRSQPRGFQESIRVSPGYSRTRIPFPGISASIDLTQPFELEIVPNGISGDITLYFGLMDFICDAQPAAPRAVAKPVKCIVWDLDNTLWDGTLMEDGLSGIRLRDEVLETIREADRRGILQSIASKNYEEEALHALRHFAIDEYFLYPQIAWSPKSESVSRIARALNIGLDSMIFVDDQAFEREEVVSTLAGVTALDAADVPALLNMPGCRLPVTEESRRRRQLYREQQQREQARESSTGGYFEFLRSCRMEIHIAPLNETNLERVYELAQRTNQMNFSGNRYPLQQLEEIARKPDTRAMVISGRDRFGDYGIVGFAFVDERMPALLDLMFSCRVQGKRVEHAVLAHLLNAYAANAGTDFYAHYRRTGKNAAAGTVFQEMGFKPAEERDGLSVLVFHGGQAIAEDGIVRIEEPRELPLHGGIQ